MLARRTRMVAALAGSYIRIPGRTFYEMQGILINIDQKTGDLSVLHNAQSGRGSALNRAATQLLLNKMLCYHSLSICLQLSWKNLITLID